MADLGSRTRHRAETGDGGQELVRAGTESEGRREPKRAGRSLSTRQRCSHSQSPPPGPRGLRLLRAFSLQDKLDKHREKRLSRNLTSGKKRA